VLPSPPSRLPSNRTAGAAHHHASSAADQAGRSLQLRRWFRKLGGGLVSAEKGMVLQSPRQGMSEPRRRLCDIFQAIRLQCWFRKLDGGLVRGKEGLVLQQRRQGLPTCSWWVCLGVALKRPCSFLDGRASQKCSLMVAALAFVPSSGVQRQLSEGSNLKDRVLKSRAAKEMRLKHWHSCHLPVLDLLFLIDAT